MRVATSGATSTSRRSETSRHESRAPMTLSAGVLRAVGAGLGQVLRRFPQEPGARLSSQRETSVAALNGAWGDHLEASGNPLVIRKSLRIGARSQRFLGAVGARRQLAQCGDHRPRHRSVRDEDWQGHDRHASGCDARVPTPLRCVLFSGVSLRRCSGPAACRLGRRGPGP